MLSNISTSHRYDWPVVCETASKLAIVLGQFRFIFRRTVEENFTRLPFEASNKAMLVTGYADEDPD